MGRALAFLTPLGRARPPVPATLGWFPLVGAAIGAVLGALWWGVGHLWPSLVGAVLVVAADLALTGMLHFDGLVDSADGLLAPGAAVEERLEIMRQPTVGAFGLVVGAVVLVARVGALSSLRPSIWLLAGIWALSRTVMAVTAGLGAPARPDGLARAMLGPGARPAAGWAAGSGLALGLAGTLAWRLGPGAAVAVAVVVAGWTVVLVARRRVGGFTGDVLGAAGVLGETVALLVAAAKW